METLSALLTLCEGNSPVTGESPSQRPVICTWTNGWINNRDAGGFRRYRAHYDVIIIKSSAATPFTLLTRNIPTYAEYDTELVSSVHGLNRICGTYCRVRPLGVQQLKHEWRLATDVGITYRTSLLQKVVELKHTTYKLLRVMQLSIAHCISIYTPFD